jgi:hypothetical protein
MEQNYLDLITLLNEQYYNYTKCVDGMTGYHNMQLTFDEPKTLKLLYSLEAFYYKEEMNKKYKKNPFVKLVSHMFANFNSDDYVDDFLLPDIIGRSRLNNKTINLCWNVYNKLNGYYHYYDMLDETRNYDLPENYL